MNESDRAACDALRQQQGRLQERLQALGERLATEASRLAIAQRELESLRREQAALAAEQSEVHRQLAGLTARLGLEAPGALLPLEAMPIAPLPIQPLEAPAAAPIANPQPATEAVSGGVPTPPATSPPTPPPLPPILVSATAAEGVRPGPPAADPIAPQRASVEPAPVRPAPGREEKASFEMRLGTYWLVRLGIVMLLTGLVFFGNYAYKHFVGRIGPAGKVGLLYLLSGALLGAGAWLYRRQAAMKNYAQVLIAGGLAAVYFTTYAAHHIPALRVIGSPLVDGALLLGWAGFMVWLADRQRSEVLALFGIGLAYYTAVMTRVGHFTLYSNLVLTLAAVVFLVRHRWATLSMASLAATYFSYGFWRFYEGGNWRWASPADGLWSGVYFLMSYWALFTAAGFLSRHPLLAGRNRAAFLSVNNGTFFVLFLLTMLQVREGGFWKFALGYGAALIVLAVVAEKFLKDEPLTARTLLTQGLALVTLGFISYFTKLRLALVLGAESVVLAVLARLLRNPVLRWGAFVAGFLAAMWTFGSLDARDRTGWIVGTALGAMLLFNAVWERRRGGDEQAFDPAAGWFTVLALATWVVTTHEFVAAERLGAVLAAEALAGTLAVYVLRLPELTFLAQPLLVLAQFHTARQLSLVGTGTPWWSPAAVLAITLGLGHWWQRQKTLRSPPETRQVGQGLYALALVALLFLWLKPEFNAPRWLVLTSALAIVITAYGAVTRAWFLAAAGQLFLWVSVMEFLRQVGVGGLASRLAWPAALVPTATLLATSLVTLMCLRRTPAAGGDLARQLRTLALVYRVVAVVLALLWVFAYIPDQHQFWVLTFVGAALFFAGGWKRSREPGVIGGAFAAVGLVIFWLVYPDYRAVFWPNLPAILALLACQQAARRRAERFEFPEPLHTAVILIGVASLWRFISRWVVLESGGAHFFLTGVWAVLALLVFAAGFALHERMYRWSGLAVLAMALGRVALFDIWKLPTIYRILSFMALGVVLLVLGFIYTKYEEKIRRWL